MLSNGPGTGCMMCFTLKVEKQDYVEASVAEKSARDDNEDDAESDSVISDAQISLVLPDKDDLIKAGDRQDED